MAPRTPYNGTGWDDILERRPPAPRPNRPNPFEQLEEEPPETPTLIPDYMEPIGDSGFFTTPMEPADPTDCERYPESPWCGGPGINIGDVIDAVPLSITPSFERNRCEACLSLAPTLFWISLPQYKICYRRKLPECDPPKPPPVPFPIPPAPSPDAQFLPMPQVPGRYPGDGCRGYTTLRVYGLNRWTGEIVSGTNVFAYDMSNGPLIGMFVRISEQFGWQHARVGFLGTDDFVSVDAWRGGSETQGTVVGGGPTINLPPPEPFRFTPIDPNCVPGEPPEAPFSPPPPDPPPPRCCMCCNSQPNNGTDLEELLRLIARRLGTDSYPIVTPQWLVTNAGDGSQTHESLTQFNVWLMQQIDALAGQFPIEVEIEDADPTQEGQQRKKVSMPNIAESLAEIYGLTAKSAIDSDVHTSFLMRLASEVMTTKIAALVAQEYASANASYLGYKGNQRKVKVNFAFNPTETDSLEGILRSTQHEFLGWRNEDNDSVTEYLEKLMFSAGIIKAVFFRKRSDIERVVNELKEFMQGEGSPQDKEWKEFEREINNPESAFNKNRPTPDLDTLQKEQPTQPPQA